MAASTDEVVDIEIMISKILQEQFNLYQNNIDLGADVGIDGGGDIVEGNLIFNTCRESGDHGK